MLIRWQWAFPGEPVPVVGSMLFPNSGGRSPPQLQRHFHLLIISLPSRRSRSARGNFVFRMIGARDMAFPTSTCSFGRLSLAGSSLPRSSCSSVRRREVHDARPVDQRRHAGPRGDPSSSRRLRRASLRSWAASTT
jgi:hypothetical protein